MRVRIIEKIYHRSNNPTLCTPFRRQREEYWIKQLGTAFPYGCNDNVQSVGNLSSPQCSNVNVMELFNTSVRRKRSHGHRSYNKPNIHDVTFSSLLPYVNKKLGIHHIRTKLYSIPFALLNELFQEARMNPYTDSSTPEYALNSIIMDIAHHRLFQPVRVTDDNCSKQKRLFLKLKFKNKGIDALNISNVLNHKKVQSCVPPYFKLKTTPCISYTYTQNIASKLFNYKQVLQCLDIDHLLENTVTCSCASSPFKYNPTGHVITGDISIVNNRKLQSLIFKGPKYREARSFNWRENFSLVMNSVEDYARRWAKHEDVEPDTLSEWLKTIRWLIQSRIRKLKGTMKTRYPSVFSDPEVMSELNRLHDHYVLVPADKASNNIVFICKAHYYNCLLEELGFNTNSGNPTYTRSSFSKDEILENHMSVLRSFNIPTTDTDFELPYLYWIPKLHKNPYKQRYIAGSSKCSTKPLSILLTKILTAVKEKLQQYCTVAYSRSGVNQMWILKNSKQLLENLKTPHFSQIHSIKTYDFSTLYTTIPHTKLKDRLFGIIDNCFFTKSGTRKFKYLVIGHCDTYFVQHHSDSTQKYTEVDIKICWNF